MDFDEKYSTASGGLVSEASPDLNYCSKLHIQQVSSKIKKELI